MQADSTHASNNRPHVDYYRYIASREWALKKRLVSERSGDTCERCKLAPAVNVHHLSYRFLGDEPLEDLIHVCADCHAFLHGHSDHDPKPERIYLNEHEWAELQDKPWFKLMKQEMRR